MEEVTGFLFCSSETTSDLKLGSTMRLLGSGNECTVGLWVKCIT